MSDRYELAKERAEKGDIDGSWKIIDQFLRLNPLDPRALVTASFLMRRIDRLPESFHFAKAATEVLPKDAATWINYGHICAALWRTEEAEAHYQRALASPTIHIGTLKADTLLNLSALLNDTGRYEEGLKYAKESYALEPSDAAKANIGFCQLAMRQWGEGWKNYRAAIGHDRTRIQYRDEPEWDGASGKTVVLYGEQGLGDEISFASMLPDAAKLCKKVILDCDPRLEGLFRRSFPQITVHGTRMAKHGQWPKEDWQFDASLPMGQVAEYVRTKETDFPGTAYLTPCPDRVAQWKALFAGRGKPVIGIAWRGGVVKTNAANRQWMLDDLLPLFKSVDAHYVSLQYKDASKEIDAFRARHPEIDLVQYKWGTLTADYDDTAALIASLDYVFCMQTSVAHTAGALGVPVMVCVPVASQWRYGTSHEHIPWYKSLRIIRQQKQGSWRTEIERGARELCADLGRLPSATGSATSEQRLRHGVYSVRAHGVSDHRANGRYPPA